MADGNTKSKDTKDAQERQAVDFEKDAAEDSNLPPRPGDRDGWRKYWQNDGYSDEEVEEKLNEMDQFPAEEARSHSPGVSWWDQDRNEPEGDVDEPERYANSDALEDSSSRSSSSSRGSHRSGAPPQSSRENDDYSKSGPNA